MQTEFKFKHHNQEFLIKRSFHLYEKRKNSELQRDEKLDETRYIAIFKNALNNGLTSFRNKGVITIVVPDSFGKYFCILCTLNKTNVIKIITVIAGYSKFWLAFRTCSNRINMFYHQNPKELYKVPPMNNVEKNKKEFDKVCHEAYISGSDMTFKQAMDFLGIR